MIGRLGRHVALALIGLIGPMLVLVIGLFLLVHDPGPVKSARLAVFDAYQQIAPRPYANTPVRVVDIDEESIRRLGSWPWSRARLAELVRRIHDAGAETIVLALVLDEPDRASPNALVRQLGGIPGVERLRFLIGRMPNPDILLAQALGEAQAVTAMRLGHAPSGQQALPPDARWSLAAIGEVPERYVPRFDTVRAPLPSLALASAGIGAINLVPDRDGVVRRAPLLLGIDGRVVPGLASETLRLSQGSGTYVTRTDPDHPERGLDYLRIGGVAVPTDPEGGLWLHLTREAPRRTMPAWTVMIREMGQSVAEADLDGAIVLIGSSDPTVGTEVLTPFGTIADVQIWAETVEQMLLGNALVRPGWGHFAEVAFLVIGGLAMLASIAALGATVALAVGAAIVVAGIGAGWGLFAGQGLLVDPIGPGAVILLSVVVGAIGRGVRTERQRAAVRAAFAHYVAPEVATELAEDPGHVELGGEIRPITIMFTDIRGFTGISEQLPPDRLTRLLTDYFTPMTEMVHGHRGTVDKFIGDGLMAFWGAPLDDPDHADHACRAALAMVARLDALNEEWRREAMLGPPAMERIEHRPLEMGIGLNTGECLVGNIGSRQRFNYTAMGDPVNLAARLEDLSKVYRVSILVGQATRDAAPDLAYLELDRITLAGRHDPTAVHALVGDEARADEPAFRELEVAHTAMLEARRRGDVSAATLALDRAAALAPPTLDGLYRFYRRRLTMPPETDWPDADQGEGRRPAHAAGARQH